MPFTVYRSNHANIHHLKLSSSLPKEAIRGDSWYEKWLKIDLGTLTTTPF